MLVIPTKAKHAKFTCSSFISSFGLHLNVLYTVFNQVSQFIWSNETHVYQVEQFNVFHLSYMF